MPYATLQNAIDLYGEREVLTAVDRDEDGVADPTAITNALAQASTFMDSYIGAVYDVPIDSPPDHMVKYAIDIAIYNCSNDFGTLTKEKRQRYEDAVAWLKDISTGKAVLGVATEDAPAVETMSMELDSSNPERRFTRSTMRKLL